MVYVFTMNGGIFSEIRGCFAGRVCRSARNIVVWSVVCLHKGTNKDIGFLFRTLRVSHTQNRTMFARVLFVQFAFEESTRVPTSTG